MNRIGSWEDGGRLVPLGKNIQSVKYRLWDGLVPLSDQRWEEKGLNQPENFDTACQHLTSVIAVFEYFNHPTVARNLRDTSNLIWEHWKELDAVNNERRAQNGEDPVSAADRWSEFIVAHHWVLSHIGTLRQSILEALRDYTPMVDLLPDLMHRQLTDRLHMLFEIASLADITIQITVYNYKGCDVPSNPPSRELSAERKKAYSQKLKQLNRTGALSPVFTGPGPNTLHETTTMRIENEEQMRRELHGPVEPVPGEPWIMNDLAAMRNITVNPVRERRLAIYRLTNDQTDEEWATFVQKLETHIGGWARDQRQHSGIAQHYKLHWLDGKTLEIADGDIDGARKRFQSHDLPSSNPPTKMVGSFFLVVDCASVASYTGTAYTAATNLVLPGDFTGFVLAVDADYSDEEERARPGESPGYHGQMRILGSLVWDEVYAMHTLQNALLEDLWPLAVDHPNYVYVGPTVPLQVRSWQVQNGVRNTLLRQMVDYVKAKILHSSTLPIRGQ